MVRKGDLRGWLTFSEYGDYYMTYVVLSIEADHVVCLILGQKSPKFWRYDAVVGDEIFVPGSKR